MTELQEFIYLLRRHPELHDQLRQIAGVSSSPNVSAEKQTDRRE